MKPLSINYNLGDRYFEFEVPVTGGFGKPIFSKMEVAMGFLHTTQNCKFKEITNSLRYKVVVLFIVGIIPLILFLYIYNYNASKAVRDEVAKSNNNLLSIYVNQIDQSLENTRTYMGKMVNDDFDLNTFNFYTPGSVDYALTIQHIQTKFYKDLYYYNIIDCLFAYDVKNKDLVVAANGVYQDKFVAIKTSISSFIKNEAVTNPVKWRLIKFNGEYSLVKLVNSYTGVYMGAIINVNVLKEPLGVLEQDPNNGIIIISSRKNTLTKSALSGGELTKIKNITGSLGSGYITVNGSRSGTKYLVVGRKSSISDLNYIVVIPEKKILGNLIFFQKTILLIPLIAILVLIGYLLFIKKLVFTPTRRLIRAMDNLSKGDLDTRLKEKYTNEHNYLVRSFNDMAAQIKKLKIDVYEEKLRVNKAEIKHLQAQISPHFYLNTLNIIYNMAALKDFKSVQKMIMHLADYFRYIIRTEDTLIKVSEELKHINNYLEIQKMRFPDKLSYEISIDEGLTKYLIPPLIIQPFVENAIIHGFSKRNEPFHIKIVISKNKKENSSEIPSRNSSSIKGTEIPEEYYTISIIDNGPGFADEKLTKLQDENYTNNNGDEHIGTWNVYRRLKYNFGNNAKIVFKNEVAGGARVTLVIPVNRTQSKEEIECIV